MTDLQKLREKGHLLGLEGCEIQDSVFSFGVPDSDEGGVIYVGIDPQGRDLVNAEAVVVLLKAIEAKGYGFSVSTDYELDDPVEDRYSRDGFRVNIWHPKYDRDVDGKGQSITEAVVKAALALCEELEP